MQGADAVYPIEAKAGTNTKAKSLRLYRETFKPSKSYRPSLLKWHPDAEPEEVPLYAVSSIAHEIEDGNSVTFDQL